MEKGKSRPTAEIDRSELESWLVLSRMPGLGDARIAKVVQRFGGPRETLSENPAAIASILGQDETKIAHALNEAKKPFLQKQLFALLEGNFRLYTIWDSDYPDSLHNIPSPPVLLFTRGIMADEDNRAVAIVGSRAATEYGKKVSYELAFSLTRAGFTVVSGLARGIDSYAHKGALDGNGRTVAVLGNGPDIAYPPENRKLMNQIEHDGAVVSEFPPGTSPNPKHFPRRNRIIAGLSMGVVVVQAKERSGALITAKHALEQNKEVMAVPGPINARTSKGPNSLIKQGAALVEDIDDILAALGEPLLTREDKPQAASRPDLDPEEKDFMRILGTEPVHIDTLCSRTGKPTGLLLANLLQLELKGVVKQLAGKHFLALIEVE